MTRCSILIFPSLMLALGCSSFEHQYTPDDDRSSHSDDDDTALPDDDAADDDTAPPDDDTGDGIPEITVTPPAIEVTVHAGIS